MVLLPPVRRANRADKSTFLAVCMFGAGVFLGGLGSGFVLWIFSGIFTAVPLSTRLWVLLPMVAAALAYEFGVMRFNIPSSSYMVPASRFSDSIPLGAFVFGMELGVGVRTRVYNSGPYLLAIMLVLMSPSGLVIVMTSLGWTLGRTWAVAIRLGTSMREGEYVEEGRMVMNSYDQVVGKLSALSGKLTASAGLILIVDLAGVF